MYVFSVVYMYLQPVFTLVNVLNKKITTSEIYLLKGRKSLSAEIENCFYQTVSLWKDEISDKNQEEIPRSSDILFEKNPKVF